MLLRASFAKSGVAACSYALPILSPVCYRAFYNLSYTADLAANGVPGNRILWPQLRAWYAGPWYLPVVLLLVAVSSISRTSSSSILTCTNLTTPVTTRSSSWALLGTNLTTPVTTRSSSWALLGIGDY
eukprot:150668-Rhodomonas_salina.3